MRTLTHAVSKFIPLRSGCATVVFFSFHSVPNQIDRAQINLLSQILKCFQLTKFCDSLQRGILQTHNRLWRTVLQINSAIERHLKFKSIANWFFSLKRKEANWNVSIIVLIVRLNLTYLRTNMNERENAI